MSQTCRLYKTLSVEWSATLPALAARNWFEGFADSPRATPPTENLQSPLPTGTREILDQAFRAKLSRSDGWQIPRDSTSPEAFLLSASVYRRGVPIRECDGAVAPARLVNGAYDIEILEGLDPSFLLAGCDFLVIDHRVAELWPALRSTIPTVELVAKESQKSLQTVEDLCAKWKSLGAGTSWGIIGGGLVGDVAAFAADLVGAKFRLVPTTLLGMVDACVGGKTGVNYPPWGKNQIGRFAFPHRVTACVDFLSTLPLREFRSGISEALKHAFIAGDLTLARQVAAIGATADVHELSKILADVIAIKARIVASDPMETGQRAVLNYGHTLGHALESLSQSVCPEEEWQLTHGEAVAFGMLFAAQVSMRCAGLSYQEFGEIRKLLAASGSLLDADFLRRALGLGAGASMIGLWNSLRPYLVQDKKNAGGLKGAQWVLLDGLGKPAVREQRYVILVEDEILHEVWEEFLMAIELVH